MRMHRWCDETRRSQGLRFSRDADRPSPSRRPENGDWGSLGKIAHASFSRVARWRVLVERRWSELCFGDRAIKGSRMRSPRYSSELQYQPDVVQVWSQGVDSSTQARVRSFELGRLSSRRARFFRRTWTVFCTRPQRQIQISFQSGLRAGDNEKRARNNGCRHAPAKVFPQWRVPPTA